MRARDQRLKTLSANLHAGHSESPSSPSRQAGAEATGEVKITILHSSKVGYEGTVKYDNDDAGLYAVHLLFLHCFLTWPQLLVALRLYARRTAETIRMYRLENINSCNTLLRHKRVLKTSLRNRWFLIALIATGSPTNEVGL